MKRFRIYEDYKVYSQYSNSKIKPFLNINFYININFRVSQLLYELKLFPISKVFWLLNRIIFAVDIDPGAKLQGGLLLIHAIGIVIGRNVYSEGKLTIYQNTTLGGNEGKTSIYKAATIKQPYLHDSIIIYPGAKILGPVVIFKNNTIAANSVITKSIQIEDSIILSNSKFYKRNDL